jgi:hypothetical protein
MHLPFTTPVRGVSFHPDTVAAVSNGDPVTFAHDPTNPHDACAVVVRDLAGSELGHLPAAVAARVVDTFGVHCRLSGEISEVVGTGEGQTRGLRVRVVDQVSAPAGAADIVHSPSGRVLGTFAGRDGDDVIVATGEGTSRYPARLVLVGSSSPAAQPA